MKHTIKILILLFLIANNQFGNAQTFSGAEGYASEYDDYLYDFMVQDGHAAYLIKRQYDNYSTKIFTSLIHTPGFLENMGTDFSGLKFTQDNEQNIYVTGLYFQELIKDTTNLFLCKFDKDGNKIWANLFEQTELPSKIFIDIQGNIYIHDNNYLIKVNANGQLLWKKSYRGLIGFYSDSFFLVRTKNTYDSLISGEVCDSIILEKIDTTGILIFSKIINLGVNENTMISTNYSLNIVDDRIFISNRYWGSINVDPSNNNHIFENIRTSYWGDKWGNVPRFNNYLAIYDTLGNLSFANSKINYPRLDYTCMDSAGSLYFAGSAGYKTDFNLISNDSIISNKSENDISFITKYSKSLDFLWQRNLTGLIKYIGISHYLVGGEEKLDIAGEYDGTINLDLERPNDITFTSEGRDLFFASYIDLNNNISPTRIEKIKYDDNLLIYPNPSNGLLHIKSTNDKELHLEIFDISGQLKFIDDIDNSFETKTINISNLKDGYYLLRLTNNHRVITKKILINK